MTNFAIQSKKDNILKLQENALDIINKSNKKEVSSITRTVLSSLNSFCNDELSHKIGISIAIDKTGRRIIIK